MPWLVLVPSTNIFFSKPSRLYIKGLFFYICHRPISSSSLFATTLNGTKITTERLSSLRTRAIEVKLTVKHSFIQPFVEC